MKKDYTHITILLDRSGSMGSCASDVRLGIAQYIADQKMIPNPCTISIHQFDTDFQTDYSFTPIQEVGEFVFTPRGGTSLYDGIGKTIVETGEKLSQMAEDDRPEKHIFIIFTDGFENASKEYTHAMVKTLMEEHTTKYSWEFLFLGANIDAVAVGAGWGMAKGKTMTYDTTKTTSVYSNLSSKTLGYRSGAVGSMDFTDDERATAMHGK